jgi:hypothetical protein
MISKITLQRLEYLTITASCPVCGKNATTDHGKSMIKDLKPTVRFWCEEHGNFEEAINWGDELNRLIAEVNGDLL